jgi:hypothetical protein
MMPSWNATFHSLQCYMESYISVHTAQLADDLVHTFTRCYEGGTAHGLITANQPL